MDYQVVTASGILALTSVVKSSIHQGWEPLGAPFQLHMIGHYGQALTRKTQRTLHEFTSSSSSAKVAEQPADEPTLSPADTRLLNALKEKRLRLAGEYGVPAYCIATNKSLLQLVAIKPKTIDELKSVSGFGPQKSQQYGPQLIQVILDTPETV